MPTCDLRVFQRSKKDVPYQTWIGTLARPGKRQNLDALAGIRSAVKALLEQGHDLRRPHAAPLRDGIYELRVKLKRVNYRVLYFFAGEGVAVIAVGCTKEGEVDDADINRALECKRLYLQDPKKHTYLMPE